MLWKKESTQVDALYVDILALTGMASNTVFWELDHSALVKSDEISLQKRLEGNALFAQDKWNSAMDKYNESLRFATIASRDIGLIYANRSACFLKMQQYNGCLKDIELAIGAGYPEHKMKKLDDRRAECIKGIENGTDAVLDTLKLSYEAHEQFPCMANVLEFERNSGGYPSIIAKEDIDVGRVILHEKLLFPFTPFESERCNVCAEATANFMPCTRCTTALFCSEECKTSQSECRLWKCSDSDMNRIAIAMTRQIFIVIKMFATVDELIDFVEEAVNGDPKEMPNESMDAKSQYRTLLRLPGQQFDTVSTTWVVHNIFQELLGVSEIDKILSVQKYRRFFMHLIAQHFEVFNTNAFINAGSLSMGYIDFSCTPNVVPLLTSSETFVLAIRPIKKGEYLMLMPGHDKHAIWEHQKSIRKYDDINCECTRCMGISISPADRISLRSDSSFGYLCATNLQNPRTRSQLYTVIQHCGSFLRKYRHMVWCEEIEYAIRLHIEYFKAKYFFPYDRSTGKLIDSSG